MLVTPLFAAVLGLLFVLLSLGVVRIRFSQRISMGVADNRALEKAVRSHANFAEYVPLALLLMWFVETLTLSSALVAVAGCVLVLARVFHAIGMANPKRWLVLRQLGVVMTFAVILVLCVVLLYWYWPVGV